MIFARTESKWPDFVHVGVTVRQAVIGDMGFGDFPDDQSMTAHIDGMQHLTFEVDGACSISGA